MAKRKTIEETEEIEQPVETPDESVVADAPEEFDPTASIKEVEEVKGAIPVAQKSTPQRGVVVLQYSGESPVRAVHNLPSGTTYKILPNGQVTVYPEDAQVLLSRPDFTRIK